MAFVSKKTGLSQPAALAVLTKNFPHTTALLQAIPLSWVAGELPGLVNFVAKTLSLTPAEVLTTIKGSFPGLYQSITNLPYVTNSWYSVPGTAHLTMSSGAAVRTMPQVRTYLATDVVPFLSTEKGDFRTVDTTWPPLPVFPPLLLIVGIVVIVYGAVMLFISLRKPAEGAHRATASSAPSDVTSRKMGN